MGFIGDVSVEPLTAAAQIEAALTQVNQQLTEFVASANFQGDLQTAFGASTDVELGSTIIEALTQGETPEMIVVSSDLMNGVNGGFDSLTGTVYLSDAIIHSDKLVDVITEEFGHYIDSQLNEIDCPGDEGELFMRLVNGEVLSEVDLTYLRNKDDRVMILGGLVEVEANQDIVIDNHANFLPEISIADTQILEGDRGRSFAEFKVTLNSPSDQMITVNFTTADGTATVADGDYQPTNGRLVFPRGQTERVIRVPVIGDTKVEPDETFRVILSDPQNVTLANRQATGTIINDDIAQISISDTQILEGDRGRSFAEFKVTLNSPSDQMITVNFTTADGTATVADGDYQPTNGRLVFPRGQTERVIRVPVIGDTKVEPDETFRVILSDPQNVTLANRQATGTILNDDVPEISIADTQILEGDRGRSFAEFKVTLNRPSNQIVRVNYATADGTATVADRDYERTRGELVFRRGQTERVIRVPVIGDTKVEPDETFKVILSDPQNADLGRDKATGTILNDDGLVSANISIADTQILEGDRGRSFAEFKVTLDRPSNQIVRVNYTTADGTATVADRDYERTRGELVFRRGQTERVIRVPVIGDTKLEPDETFKVILSNPQNAELERGEAIGTILDDDDPERGSWDNPFVLGNLTGEIVRTNRIGFIESGKRDVNDYYSFRLNRTGTVTINLDDLVANANLQLLGSQGELIDQSNNPGTQAETIMQRDLEPGIYHVRVHPHVSARTKYRLSIELI
ncbi:MAG: Calx-beta domain-containing protein [Limnospira sp. PMC 894.15]|uniref:Calx-beta domain-containing protein n=1 Tax=Limnospira sp. PMC 894.15 TaxID=2981100 RepID=UPI0028E102BB|nr:Calx-beta domain-containing protein [Limnospira sp. PMC 894.15]MDT9190907.1 Calx-beta domain-containing protein [Limnospira sp. PMC 894.15]